VGSSQSLMRIYANMRAFEVGLPGAIFRGEISLSRLAYTGKRLHERCDEMMKSHQPRLGARLRRLSTPQPHLLRIFIVKFGRLVSCLQTTQQRQFQQRYISTCRYRQCAFRCNSIHVEGMSMSSSILATLQTGRPKLPPTAPHNSSPLSRTKRLGASLFRCAPIVLDGVTFSCLNVDH